MFNVMCYPAGMDTTILGRPLPIRHKNEPCCGTVEAPSLTQAQTQHLAARLKALADPTRLRILDLLAQQPAPLCVCDLTPQFSQNQPTISHHLKLLREAGLIETEKQGIWAYYWATPEGRRTLAAITTLT
jgi:ArsR family transcriptional regulator